jgi:hypothetical protein
VNNVDALIRALIHGERQPADDDATTILEHIAGSTFYPGRRNIPRPLQELMIRHGYEVPDRGDDIIYHWAKHVLEDQQWTVDTTATAYFQFAVRAVTHPASRLLVQFAPSGHRVAVVISAVDDIVPLASQGPRSGRNLLVVYSADVGRIVSAHMTASTSRITSRTGTVWLRR